MGRSGEADRSPSQVARDRVIISRLYLAGKNQYEIAETINKSQSLVCIELKEIQKAWESRYTESYHAKKMEELAKIDTLERTYLEQFELSKQNRVVKEQKTGSESYSKTRTELNELGDPRYLRGVEWCIERRCKLLGLDSPIKVAQTDPTGEHEYSNYSDSKIARLLLAAFAGIDEGNSLAETEDPQ